MQTVYHITPIYCKKYQELVDIMVALYMIEEGKDQIIEM